MFFFWLQQIDYSRCVWRFSSSISSHFEGHEDYFVFLVLKCSKISRKQIWRSNKHNLIEISSWFWMTIQKHFSLSPNFLLLNTLCFVVWKLVRYSGQIPDLQNSREWKNKQINACYLSMCGGWYFWLPKPCSVNTRHQGHGYFNTHFSSSANRHLTRGVLHTELNVFTSVRYF